jgi:hypothetical protein
VAGVLSSLSVAAIEQVRLEGLMETISLLADWLLAKKKNSPQGPQWPQVISFEEETGSPSIEEVKGGDEFFLLRSLYLASKALNKKELRNSTERAFLNLDSEEKKKDLSLISGKAGIFAITYRMSRETHHPILFKRMQRLECDLTNSFDPSLPFGFPTTQNQTSAGIFNGAAGIALALLLAQEKEEGKWDRMFLFR